MKQTRALKRLHLLILLKQQRQISQKVQYTLKDGKECSNKLEKRYEISNIQIPELYLIHHLFCSGIELINCIISDSVSTRHPESRII